MKKVVWGILSTARIGIDHVVPALKASPLVDLRAIASRSLPAARATADKPGHCPGLWLLCGAARRP